MTTNFTDLNTADESMIDEQLKTLKRLLEEEEYVQNKIIQEEFKRLKRLERQEEYNEEVRQR